MSFSFVTSANRTIEELAHYFNSGFTGYFDPVNFNAASFSDYVRAYQIDTARSMLAFNENGDFAGCAMLGIKGQRGWIGGFGVAPAFRGSGVARQLMEATFDQARNSKLTSLTLEVLTPNERAYQLYLRTGFEVTRQTLVFGASETAVLEATPTGHLAEVEEVEPGQALAMFGMPEHSLEFPPCWQRDSASILSQRGARARIGRLMTGEELVLIYLPAASRRKAGLLHVGFDRGLHQEAQALLLGKLLTEVVNEFGPAAADVPAASFSIINEPEGSPLGQLLTSLGFTESWREYEMLLKL